MDRLFDKWNNKRIFRIERDRFKPKKYIYQSFVKINCQGFNNKNLYPFLYSDSLSKYYRMNGYNVMYPIGFNNLNQDTYMYCKKRGETFISLKDIYKEELCAMGIGFDNEKVIALSDESFIKFTQLFFNKLYLDGYIKIEEREVYCDMLNQIYPTNKVEVKDGEFYSTDSNEKISKKKKTVVLLNIDKIPNLIDEIYSLNIPSILRDEMINHLSCKKGINISLLSNMNNMSLDINLDDPQYMAGIKFIAINPNYIDVLKYTTTDEINTLIEYINDGNHNIDCYTGMTLMNPLTNNDIHVFASYKYEEAIHIGYPSLNVLDHMFYQECGFDEENIIDNDILINSDFLNGYTISQAKDIIIEAFCSEGMATSYLKPYDENLIISSNDNSGIIIPLYEDLKQELHLIDKNAYPIYFSNRYKIQVENEDYILDDTNISKLVFSDSFIRGLLNIYSRIYDEYATPEELLEDVSNYNQFKDTIGIFEYKNSLNEILYNTILNIIFKNYNKDYSNYNKIHLLDDSSIDQLFFEEHQNLGVSFVEEILNRFPLDVYRLYLFDKSSYEDDLGKTLQELKEYNYKLMQIKNTFKNGFSEGVFEHQYFIDFKISQTKLLEAGELKKYTRNLIEFFNEYILTENIFKNEAYDFLILFSLICPLICEELNEDVFNDRYSIYLKEWPK